MKRGRRTSCAGFVAGLLAAAGLAGAGARGEAPGGGPGLEDCIAAALDANPDAEAAWRRVDEARAVFEQAAAGYYPRVTLSGDVARTDNPPQAFMMALNQRVLDMADPGFDPNAPGDTENVRFSAAAAWRLLDGGRRVADRRRAWHGVEASEAALAAARNGLIHEVTRSFYGVLQARAFAVVREEQVASLEEGLRVARERFDSGAAVKTDVLQLEVELAQAREDLVRARNAARLAEAALNTAVGRDVLAAGGGLAPPAGEPARTGVDPDAPDAVDGRPERAAALAGVRAREQGLARARRDYAPAVSAFGSLDWDSGELSGFERSYLVGVRAEWDLFDGLRRPRAVAAARAALAAARAQAESVRNRLRLELRQAVLQEEEARERMGVTGKSVESATEALRLAGERYRQGAADLGELLRAQAGWTAVRTREIAARYDARIARSNVERATGALVRTYAR